MEELRLNTKDKQDARIALLSHYSSECIAHSIYLLALTIALLSFVEFTPHILEPLTTSQKFVRSTLLSLMASVFTALFVYLLGQIILWSYLRSAILCVKPKGGNEVTYNPEETTATFLLQLHEGCLDYVKKKHEIWARFYELKTKHLALIWFNLFIIFLIVSLLLLYP